MKNQEFQGHKKDPFENVGQSHIELKITRLRNLANIILQDLDWLETALDRKTLNISDGREKKILEYLSIQANRDHVKREKSLFYYAQNNPLEVSNLWCKQIKLRYGIRVVTHDIMRILEDKEENERETS